jgi:hypothetical protein
MQDSIHVFTLLQRKRIPFEFDKYLLVDGASHGYIGKEIELVAELIGWINSYKG